MNVSNELRINCYELVGYFWATARTLVQKSRVAMTSFIGPPNQKSWLRQRSGVHFRYGAGPGWHISTAGQTGADGVKRN